MRVSTAYPSKFIRPEDLGDKRPRLIIRTVTRERIGEDERLVVWFEGTRKGLVLNKTNANTIARQLGDESDLWTGQGIVLAVVDVDYRGSSVPAIRVQQTGAPRSATAPAAPVDPFGPDEDSIGF